jgi:hypothetical protein
MKFEEVQRILQTEKMKFIQREAGGAGQRWVYMIRGKPNQIIGISAKKDSGDLIVWMVELYDADKLVAEFDARKK